MNRGAVGEADRASDRPRRASRSTSAATIIDEHARDACRRPSRSSARASAAPAARCASTRAIESARCACSRRPQPPTVGAAWFGLGVAPEQRAIRRGGERRERRRRPAATTSAGPFMRLPAPRSSCSCRFHMRRVIARVVLGMVVAEDVQDAVHDEPQQLLAHACDRARCAFFRATSGEM